MLFAQKKTKWANIYSDLLFFEIKCKKKDISYFFPTSTQELWRTFFIGLFLNLGLNGLLLKTKKFNIFFSILYAPKITCY